MRGGRGGRRERSGDPRTAHAPVLRPAHLIPRVRCRSAHRRVKAAAGGQRARFACAGRPACRRRSVLGRGRVSERGRGPVETPGRDREFPRTASIVETERFQWRGQGGRRRDAKAAAFRPAPGNRPGERSLASTCGRRPACERSRRGARSEGLFTPQDLMSLFTPSLGIYVAVWNASKRRDSLVAGGAAPMLQQILT